MKTKRDNQRCIGDLVRIDDHVVLRSRPWNYSSSKYLANVADARTLYVIIGVHIIDVEIDYCVTNCRGDAGWTYHSLISGIS